MLTLLLGATHAERPLSAEVRRTRKGRIMSLTFPRKFTRGQKVSIADVYGELHVWPDGHFHYAISIRNTEPGERCRVSASFVLFDQGNNLLGTYGALPDEAQFITPWGRVDHDLYGKIPGEKLARAESVALAFRLADQATDVDKLREVAGVGNELVLCSAPE